MPMQIVHQQSKHILYDSSISGTIFIHLKRIIDSSIYSNNVNLHLIKMTHLLTQGYISLKVFGTNKFAIMQDHAVDCA
jgi:hypothetical protein